MTRRQKRKGHSTGDNGSDHAAPSPSDRKGGESKVKASGWTADATELRYRTFPGPDEPPRQLRVAITRQAYGDLTVHARRNLDVEVCGVLVGELCEDDRGPFVAVEAIIEGTDARQGAAHVTFTQETWTEIHAQREARYPRLQIVGWYHTHPGFGVQFSDMDMFIQENFFSGPYQVALVTDPLGGEDALCVNTPDGVESIDRFWVDGRERRCRSSAPPDESATTLAPGGDEQMARALRDVEARLTQLIKALDDTRATWHRALLTVGMVIAVAVVFLVVYNVYDSVLAAHQPPKEFKYTKVPVKVGDKWVLLGAQVIQWEIPPEVEAAYLDHLLAEIKAREEAARQKAEKDQAGATEQKDPSDESRAEPANDKKGARATRAKGKDAP